MHTHTHTLTLYITHSHPTDFYEEMLALLDLFTTVSVSEQMWPMLEVIYETFTRDGYDYFTGICSYVYVHVCVSNYRNGTIILKWFPIILLYHAVCYISTRYFLNFLLKLSLSLSSLPPLPLPRNDVCFVQLCQGWHKCIPLQPQTHRDHPGNVQTSEYCNKGCVLVGNGRRKCKPPVTMNVDTVYIGQLHVYLTSGDPPSQ